MKEHHFVIKYTNEGGWEWDTDTEAAHFTDGTIYDTQAGEWQPAHEGEGVYVDNDDDVSDQLSSMLHIINESMGKGVGL
jgi:hypothetical protein